MKLTRGIAALLAGIPIALAPLCAQPEDIDLFVGSTSTAATNPNVLIIIDNSANWSAANQQWPGGVKQGQSELRSLRTVIGEASSNINIGLMMFTTGTGSATNGGYVRFAMRQMTDTNKAALQELIGDDSCVDGANSLNGTADCIYKNFDSSTEKVGTSVSDYSAAMFEAFKYFGGYTSPANAQTDTAGSPADSSHFGALRYAGNPDANSDPAAFDPTSQRTTYNPATSATSSCAKNYIIFIGNGFPNQDSPSSLLTGVGGDATTIAEPQFTTTSSNVSTTLGTDAVCESQSSCVSRATSSFSGYSTYTCSAGTSCGGNKLSNQTMTGTNTVFTVTPTGTYAFPSSSKERKADEWARFLVSTDVSAAPGQQTVKTFAIDVFNAQEDTNQTALLYSMAKVGGGQYYSATSESAILKALRDALIQIQSDNSVFSAAALPVSATNRAQNQNQVFFGMFRPDASARPRWYGNLKRYQIGLDSTGSLITADQTGANAISSASGFFNPCAVSYWTTDSGTYWNFGGNTPGDCSSSSNSSYSDDPDGALVERGGAAEVIRRGNDPSAISPFTVNRTMYTCTSTSSCPASNSTGMVTFNTTNVSQTALGVSSSATQQLVVNYTLGQDVNDENSNNNVTEPRPSIHGDVVHARPQAVNYGGSTGVVVYYGANDGPFRAVKSDTGQELWSFVAPEHLSKLQRLYNNSPIINYPGVTDASAQAKDYFFDGTAGLYQNADNSKVWIYPTMRRGGRMLYAFDVTTPTAPVLKWRVGCPDLTDDTGCTSGFSHIGQTWSFPNVAGIKGYSSGTSPVIIIGGGYDSCEDSDTPVPSCDNEKGARVYAIDALTGSLIARFDTDRSVAADVALIDRDFDGLADHAYVADTGGNLYRIDFVDPSTLASRSSGSWTITKIAAVTSNAGRKFLFAPSVLVAQNKAYIALGSGNRERPLATNYPYVQNITNRFYMFVDTFGTSGDSIDLDGSSLADNTSGTTCVTPTSTLRGWRMDLATGTGEQTVSSAVISGGRILFNTHRATEASANQCGANLGVAQGYNVGLLCADKFVVNYAGIGLPISPVQGTVTLPGNKVQTFVLGGSTSSTVNTPFAPGKVTPSITQKRARVYWYTNGDK